MKFPLPSLVKVVTLFEWLWWCFIDDDGGDNNKQLKKNFNKNLYFDVSND